ncbi:dnaJ domain-containing protein [Ditylenchus destructor]|uniref:DnaJ domain-containing protein n=1 Tax=Ditylenchus destructor TaxID=166010 RepID=A0AAD4R5Z9_9BILA|nr:dnaJ domain-containing protein [Ditylenchus destructor]
MAADNFEQFYSGLKETEQIDSKLTSSQQMERLLRPGSTYLNLNPFEVLQLEPDMTVEEARKKYKKLSLLLHPDKNPDDRDRAQRAFEILKKAIATIEDPDELSRCREVYAEAKARLAIVMSEKKRKLRKEGKNDHIEEDEPAGYAKALWMTVTKVFADREKKRKTLEERANEEKRRMADEAQAAAEKRKMDEEYKKNYEETRDERRGSWREFVKKKERKLESYRGANFKPPTIKLETSKKDGRK